MRGKVTEASEQAALFEWAAHMQGKYPELQLLYHIPNEGKRSVVTGANLKRQGLKKGVPDICLPVARGRYHGLYIEMKAEKGKLTPEQEMWLAFLSAQGYCAIVCHGCDQGINAIERYMRLEG